MRSFSLIAVLVVFCFLARNIESINPYAGDNSNFDLWMKEDFQGLFKNTENLHLNDIIKGISNFFNHLKNLKPKIFNFFGLRKQKKLEWWQNCVIYQIYPRSFMDTTGNGVGDLQGIIEKIPYLKELGVGAIWLNPIHPSSGIDSGYDITDYKNIDKLFGSMIDFDKLKNKLHENGIKIILDFVPNHTSDEHEWFVKSVKKIEPYTDYYVWVDAKYVNKTKLVPNNWTTIMGGTTWAWNDQRQQYYYHQFFKEQPDLNFRNPLVRKELKEVLRFWLDKGVDGFRMDSISYLFERNDLIDAPPTLKKTIQPHETQQSSGYKSCLDETFEEVQVWRAVLDEYKKKDGVTRLMAIESYDSMEDSVRFYGNSTHPGAHFPLNLNLGFLARRPARHYVYVLTRWLLELPPGAWSSWEIGNHDLIPRPATRFGAELIDGIHMIQLLLPGTPVIYMGDEIGMTDTYLRDDQFIDEWSKNDGYAVARERNRTPFQWNSTNQAGFSKQPKTWLPVNPNYVALNVECEKNATRSHLKIFKELLSLRQLEAFCSGDVEFYEVSEYVFAFSRSYKFCESFYVVVNLNNELENIDLSNVLRMLPFKMKVIVASLYSEYKTGDVVRPRSFTLRPNAAVVLSSSCF